MRRRAANATQSRRTQEDIKHTSAPLAYRTSQTIAAGGKGARAAPTPRESALIIPQEDADAAMVALKSSWLQERLKLGEGEVQTQTPLT